MHITLLNPLGRIALLSTVVVSLLAPTLSFASGGYSSRLTHPPTASERSRVDREKFDLGQKVFLGKVAPGQGTAAVQRPKLEALQALLPAKLAKGKDLPALAGKLSDSQLEALDYYVTQRYPKAK